MDDHVYKLTEIVGTSHLGTDQAIQSAPGNRSATSAGSKYSPPAASSIVTG